MKYLYAACCLLLFTVSSFAGTVTGRLLEPSGLPIKDGVLDFHLRQAALAIGSGAVVPDTATCFTSADGSVVGLPNPLILPNVAINYGSGTMAPGVYYVSYTFYDGSGARTLASPELQVQLTSAGSLEIIPPASFPSNAVGMTVFIGTVSGEETGQGDTVGPTQVFLQNQTPVSTTTALPTVNATSCTIAFNDTIIPYTGYDVSLVSASGNAYPGWPQSWQLNGGLNGTVNVSNGAPLWNGVVIYRLLRTGEFEICDNCPKTFEALRTRIHDDTRPGDIRKIPGDPLDDVADETRYALYTFIQQATTPRQVILQDAIRGLPLGSATIRWEQKAEQLDREDVPLAIGTGAGRLRRTR
jgi:hypothetical protein